MISQAAERGLSQRRACRLADVARSSARYQAHPRDDQPLREQLEQIKHKYPRFGIPHAHALLRAGGQVINRKRVERLWRKYRLQVPQRPKKRRIRTGRRVP